MKKDNYFIKVVVSILATAMCVTFMGGLYLLSAKISVTPKDIGVFALMLSIVAIYGLFRNEVERHDKEDD